MYLRLLLNNKELRNDRNVLEFAEICLVSFLYDCGQKNKYASLTMFSFQLTNNHNILIESQQSDADLNTTILNRYFYRKHVYHEVEIRQKLEGI